MNKLFAEHNTAVDGFEAARAERKDKLKRHFLADTKSEHLNLVALQTEGKTKLEGADEKLNALRREMKKLRDEMREHGPAAERLNQLIASYLGHNRISVLPDEEGYQICRDGSPSLKPLSEGEKTALAFWYFIVSLESEGRKIDDLIIVIDDPISSLDARAMSHVVSLVKFSVGKCLQLLVITHNLDFLREKNGSINGENLENPNSFS